MGDGFANCFRLKFGYLKSFSRKSVWCSSAKLVSLLPFFLSVIYPIFYFALPQSGHCYFFTLPLNGFLNNCLSILTNNYAAESRCTFIERSLFNLLNSRLLAKEYRYGNWFQSSGVCAFIMLLAVIRFRCRQIYTSFTIKKDSHIHIIFSSLYKIMKLFRCILYES